jgi:carboxymethylenebutenolidase
VSELALPYFLATPASADGGPGVVVIHEGNGISSQLLRWCQRLAREGYVVVAPDLYFRAGGTEAADPMTLIRAADFGQMQQDILQAAGIAREHGARKLGVTGFCMGGRLTYGAALAGGFDAAAGFYGSGIAGHGFMRDGTPDYVPAAADDAWDKLTAHFREHLS